MIFYFSGINRDTTSESSDEDPGVQAAIADQTVSQQQQVWPLTHFFRFASSKKTIGQKQ